MRLAFCIDGYRDQVGVEVRQNDLLEANGLPVIFWVVPGLIGAQAQKLVDSMEFLPANS